MAEKSFGSASGAEPDTCDSREIRRTTPRESPRTSRCLRLRAAFPSGAASQRLRCPTSTASSPTWWYRLRRARFLHTGCARNNSPDSLFSLISCEIQYPKFSTTGWKRDLTLCVVPSRVHSLSLPLPFCPSSETSPIQNCAETTPRCETRKISALPMERWNSAPCNRGINRYWRCWALYLRPGKTFLFAIRLYRWNSGHSEKRKKIKVYLRKSWT